MKDEPAVTAGTITSIVGAVIAIAISFGMNLNKDQVAAILGFFVIAGPVISSLLARGYVTPVDSGKGTVISVSTDTPAVDVPPIAVTDKVRFGPTGPY